MAYGSGRNKNRIIAGNGTENEGRFHAVDHFGYAVRTARQRFNNNHGFVAVNAADLVTQERPHAMVFAFVIEGIARSFRGCYAANAHLRQVTRERGLVYIEAGLLERALQVVLRTDMLFRYKFTNGKLPLVLRGTLAFGRTLGFRSTFGLAHAIW